MKVNYLKAQFGSIHFTTDCLIFVFTPECQLPGKRRDSLVDRIFNCIYLDKQQGKVQIARLDGLERKSVVFTSASLRNRRRGARLHQR